MTSPSSPFRPLLFVSLGCFLSAYFLCGEVAAKELSPQVIKTVKAGNFMYTPNDLANFENQLDYIEKSFWVAASFPKADPFSMDFEKKLFDLVCLSRNIQASLVVMQKSNSDINLPGSTLRLENVWKKFAGKGPFPHESLYCLSRRSYGKNSDSAAYLQWLADTMVTNVNSFKNSDECSIAAKPSDYYMAIKDLRCNIIAVAKQNIFYKNPLLSTPDKANIIQSPRSARSDPKKPSLCTAAK